MTDDESGVPQGQAPPPSLAVRALRALNAHAEPDQTEPAQTEPAQTEPDQTEPDQPGSQPAPPTAQPDAAQPDATGAEPAAPAAPAAPQPARRPRSTGLVVTAAALLAALVFCVLAAVSWHSADEDTTVARAAARDAVLRGARIDIETVNTSDYHDPGKVLDSWTAVSTGALAGQYRANRADAIGVLSKAKVVTKATVLDAAVTVLDASHGKATVIASVDVVRTPSSGTPVRTRNRFQATLQKVGASWLLSGLKIVAVQLS